MDINKYNSLGGEEKEYLDVLKLDKELYGTSLEYGLKDRLAIRIASVISGALHEHTYSENDKQLVFDALADGLMKRTEDELLSLIK